MSKIINLSTILHHIEDIEDYPKDINELNKTIKKNKEFDKDPIIDYIINNKVFFNVFCNLNPDLKTSNDPSSVLKTGLSKLESVSLRNILFTCSILALNKNEMTSLYIKKIIMSSYICRDIIDKVNFYRKASHNPENFFLYALFHDIGEIMVSTYYENDVKISIFDPKKTDLTNINLIAPHNEIGYLMARKWQLPAIFSYICLNHNKLEYRKFTADFIYIINAIAVSDAVALELLDYDIPSSNSWDVGHSIYKIGLREDDIYTKSGIIGAANKKISKILNLFNLK